MKAILGLALVALALTACGGDPQTSTAFQPATQATPIVVATGMPQVNRIEQTREVTVEVTRIVPIAYVVTATQTATPVVVIAPTPLVQATPQPVINPACVPILERTVKRDNYVTEGYVRFCNALVTP